ncbi:MAG: TolC family protein [Sphingobium sp.]|nr:TolC family protein [Sphingobium sp.]
MKRRLLAVWLAGVALPAQATTLEQAIDAAVAHAPELAASQAEADAADARVAIARGSGLPTASISATIGIGRLDPGGFFGLGAANVTPRAVQVGIEQPLYAGGRVKAAIAQARAGQAAARAAEGMTRGQIVASVAQAYGDVLAAHQMRALYAQLQDQMSEVLRQANLRYKAGESPSTDVAQAKARLAEAQAAGARADGMLVAAQAHFTNLTGLAASDLQPLPQSPALPASLDEAMDLAMHHNPALAQAEATRRAAQAGARGAKGAVLPSVGAFAEGAVVRDQFFPDYRADSATFGVRARWQFIDPAGWAKIRESSSMAKAAEARATAARQQIEELVIAAFQGLRTAALVEEAATQQAQSAALARESIAHEVRVGMKPQLDLLDAQREATGAAAALARASTDRIVAAYQLLALLGQ